MSPEPSARRPESHGRGCAAPFTVAAAYGRIDLQGFATRGGGVRYYFSIAGAFDKPDKVGVDLAILSDARIEAVKFAAEYLRTRPNWSGWEKSSASK
jgi:hypothetical protein